MRLRSMSALAVDGDANGIRSCLGVSGRDSHLADGKIVRVMQRNADVRLGKAREQARL